MRFPGATLALISPVNTELTDRSVQTTIYFSAGASDCVIKFGPLVTFCVLVYSLGNAMSPQIGATTFSFAYFLLSLDDSKCLGPSSSSLAISPLYF